MIIKILGIFDIIAAVIFWSFSFFGAFSKTFVLIAGFYLLIKGVIFVLTGDVASIGDIVCSLIIFIGAFLMLPKLLVFIVAFFLLQKGIIGLF